MVHFLNLLKEKCTAKGFAIFLGLLTTILIVVIVILAVDNASMSADLKESKVKMEILELYIQSMVANGSNKLTTSMAAS
ncbi:uncharacterized protein LOC124419317 [Lucilia cuprina]|uniref:uncharacterized protein LOC124419317 n=1 Tax=Lucilia cuprina TaxID=7375 RepID=UPI001F067AE8|nr:uncharacterized protein LOC124419317 [Lucilia cuprina]